MDIDKELAEAILRSERANILSQIEELKKTHGDDEYVRLAAQHTGCIRIDNTGADVEFSWTGGETILVSDEFADWEFVKGSHKNAIQIGSFILDFIQQYPQYALALMRRRELEMT